MLSFPRGAWERGKKSIASKPENPIPYTLYPIPYTLFPKPYTLFPIPTATMDAIEAIFTRRSIRRYLDKPVPEELVQKLLAAAMQAPAPGTSSRGSLW